MIKGVRQYRHNQEGAKMHEKSEILGQREAHK
jgi:hypothetical protein